MLHLDYLDQHILNLLAEQSSEKKSPVTVTAQKNPFLISVAGEASKSGVFVAALYPPWNTDCPMFD